MMQVLLSGLFLLFTMVDLRDQFRASRRGMMIAASVRSAAERMRQIYAPIWIARNAEACRKDVIKVRRLRSAKIRRGMIFTLEKQHDF